VLLSLNQWPIEGVLLHVMSWPDSKVLVVWHPPHSRTNTGCLRCPECSFSFDKIKNVLVGLKGCILYLVYLMMLATAYALQCRELEYSKYWIMFHIQCSWHIYEFLKLRCICMYVCMYVQVMRQVVIITSFQILIHHISRLRKTTTNLST
jgi:hypothetical protein